MAGANHNPESPRAPVPSDRIPPHSMDAERAVLGCILQDAERVMDLCIRSQVTSDSFYLQTHRLLFEAMLGLHTARKPVDFVTVTALLRDNQQLDTVGGEDELARLIAGTPTTAHAEYYIQLVYESHLLRRVIDTARSVTEDCFKNEQPAEDVLSAAEGAFFALSESRVGGEKNWATLINDEIVQIEKLISERKGITGLSTGYDKIDEMLSGMQAGDLIVLAARPSMGKTSLALNIAENVALGARKQPPRAVAVFSLEMSAESLVRRMVCGHARVPAQNLSKGIVSVQEHRQLVTSADALRNAPIYVDPTAGLEALDLRARARRLKRKHDIQFIVVDYLQLMNYSKYAAEGRQRETAAISAALKAMAKELKVPVMVLSQLSRAPETRDRLVMPKLSDLRDSGAIEQDADVVFLLRRPSKYPADPEASDETLAVVDIAKHRNGPTGEVRMNFTENLMRFESRREGVDS